MKKAERYAASRRGRSQVVVCVLAGFVAFSLLTLAAESLPAQDVPIQVELLLPDTVPANQTFGVRVVARASVEVSRGYVKLALSPGVRVVSGRVSYVGTLTPGEPVELEAVLALASPRGVVDASAFALGDDGRIAFGRTRSLHLEREGGFVRARTESRESLRRAMRLEAIEQEMGPATTSEARAALAEQLAAARMEGYILREAEANCALGCTAAILPDELVRLAEPVRVNEAIAGALEENVAGHFAGLPTSSFRFTGHAGDRIYLTASSRAFDPYLYLFDPSGHLVGEDDDSGGGTSARFPREQLFELSQDGEYTIAVRSVVPGGQGAFDLRVVRLNESTNSALSSLHFSANVVAPGTVELRWEASATSGDLSIERDAGSGFEEISSLPAGQSSYVDSGLARNRAYTYRLRFYDRSGFAGASYASRVYTSPVAEQQGLADRALRDQAQTLGDAFRAQGTFMYNLDGTATPIRQARVEIRNGTASSSTLLATGRTDNSGNYDIQVSSGQVSSSSVSVFARVYTADNIGGHVTIAQVSSSSSSPASNLYFFDTTRTTNFNTQTINFGIVNAASANANGPFLFYDAMVEGFKISQNLLNFTPPTITVITPLPSSLPAHLLDDSQAFYVNGQIFIDTGYNTSRDVALHEYGHYIADLGSFSQTAGGTYTVCGRGNASLAWGEGWASFFAVAGQNALGRNDSHMQSNNSQNTYDYDLEASSGAGMSTANRADDNPCSVSAVLWDLYDSTQDNLSVASTTDQVSVGFPEVAAVAASGVRLVGGLTRVSLLEMYYDAWFQRRFDIETSQSASKAQAIFRDQGMNYPVPPAAASGAVATATSATAANLTWQDNSNNETGFRIERRSGSSGSFQFVTNAAANATSYNDTGLTTGVTYTYRVQAFTRNTGRVTADLPIRFSNETTASPTGTQPGLTPITLGQTIDATLTTADGQSTLRPGRFADRYRLRLDASSSVTITLTSTSFDTYLFLLDSLGRVILQNDDAGGSLGLNSRIIATLAAGDYTIEVTSFSTGATGAYRLVVAGSQATTTTLSVGQTVNGSLAAGDPVSTLRSGSFADRYTFTLSATTSVVIAMGSRDFDTYLFLLSSTGSVLASDDDSGDGTNSRITRTLNAGTYIIEATSYSARATGNYTLSLQSGAGGGGTVTPITIPTTVPGTIATTDSSSSCRSGSFADRYSFTLSAQTSLRITLSSSAFDAYLCLFDSNGNRLATDDDSGGGLNSRIVTTLSAGNYIIEATTFGAGTTGSYTLTVETSGTGVPTAITVGQTVSGSLSSTDATSRLRPSSFADLYSFSLTAQTSVVISMTSSAFDTYLYLFRGSGTLVTQDDDGGAGTNSLITVSLAAGDYVIEATSFSGGATGSYTLSLNGTSVTTTAIAVGQSVSGSLGSTDAISTCRSGSSADRYSLSISQTSGVIISMNSTAFDTYLCLFDSTGRLVNQDDDSGGNLNSRITAALSAGSYIIEATSFSSGATGSYTLSVTAASSGQVTPIPSPLPQTINGSLVLTDALSTLRQGSFADRYSLTLSQSTSVDINISSCQFDSYMYLVNSAGSVISQDDDGGSGLCSRITTSLAAGTYIIEVTSFSSGATGSYTLVVSQAGGAPTAITVGQTVPGSLASTDGRSQCRSASFADRYSLTLTNSTPLTITLSSTAFDAYLCLFSSSGSLITQDDDSGGGTTGTDSRIVRTLSAGTYIIEATSYFSSATGSYTLSVQQSSTGGGGSITVGQTVSASLTSASATSTCRPGSFADRYTFTLSAQTAVVITLISNQFDTYLCLLSGTGSVLAQDDDSGGGLNSRISQTLSAGTYTIEATTFSSGATGSYTVSLQSGTGGGGGTATTINVGQTLTGTLASTDPFSTCRSGSHADRYTFTLTATTSGTINLSSSAFDTYLCLFDSTNTLLAQDDDSGGNLNSSLSGTLAAGTYFIEATSYDLSGSGTYTLSLTTSAGGGGGGTVTQISVGQTVNGNLTSSAAASTCRSGTFADRYSFSLTSSTALTITLTASFDTYLCLFNSANSLINFNDDAGGTLGLNSQIVATLSSGTYFIEATSYASGATGSYTLALASGTGGGGGGGGGGTVSATPISVGQTVSGTLSTSDQRSICDQTAFADRYSFTLTATTSVIITMRSSEFDTYLCLADSQLTRLIAFDDDTGGGVLGTDSQISITLSAGSYIIDASSFRSNTTGNYTLSLLTSTSSGGGGGGGGTISATPISLGQTANGNLSSASGTASAACRPSGAFADRYSFTLGSSSAVTITMTSAAFDTYLCLFGSANNLVAFNDDINFPTDVNSRIATTLSAGSYTIEATSFNVASGPYTLSLQSGIVATAPPVATLRLGDSVTGKLEPGHSISACMAGVGHAYGLEVPKESAVEIRMNILQANTALCLYDNRGELLARQDVTIPGEVRIARTLPAGKYRVEAASGEVMPLVYKISAQLAGPTTLRGSVPVGSKNSLPLTSGAVAQVADGQFGSGASAGNFTTTMMLVNPNSAQTTVQMSFRDDHGNPLSLNFDNGTSGSFLNINLAAQGATFLRTTGTLSTVTTGSAQVLSTLPINGTFVFAQSQGGRILSEAAVNIFEPSSALMVPVDNAIVQGLGTLSTGLAISNMSSQPSDVALVFRDDKGIQISQTTISLPPGGHLSAGVPDLIPASKDLRGSLEVTPTPGTEVVAVGIRARGYSRTITALPVITETGTNFLVPQLADGPDTGNAIFQTSFIFVNPDPSTAANLSLSFRDGTGAPLALQFTGQGKGSSFNLQVPPRGTLFLDSDGSSTSLVQGSAVVTSDIPVNGEVIFMQSNRTTRTQVFGEAPVPLASSRGEVMVPVENAAGFITGFAVANATPGQTASVQLSMTDENGAAVGSAATVQLTANGQTPNLITNLIPQSVGRRGTLRIRATTSGMEITAVGVRGNLSVGTLTSLPVIGTSTQQ